jgi:hypothetical protein
MQNIVWLFCRMLVRLCGHLSTGRAPRQIAFRSYGFFASCRFVSFGFYKAFWMALRGPFSGGVSMYCRRRILVETQQMMAFFL